jgi:hypothetical protein
MNEWKQYRRKQIAELRPYVPGEDLSWGKVSISAEDLKAGSPKPGDMIARNPKNHADQWLVAAAYFAENFEPIPATPEPSEPPCACVNSVENRMRRDCGWTSAPVLPCERVVGHAFVACPCGGDHCASSDCIGGKPASDPVHQEGR